MFDDIFTLIIFIILILTLCIMLLTTPFFAFPGFLVEK